MIMSIYYSKILISICMYNMSRLYSMKYKNIYYDLNTLLIIYLHNNVIKLNELVYLLPCLCIYHVLCFGIYLHVTTMV